MDLLAYRWASFVRRNARQLFGAVLVGAAAWGLFRWSFFPYGAILLAVVALIAWPPCWYVVLTVRAGQGSRTFPGRHVSLEIAPRAAELIDPQSLVAECDRCVDVLKRRLALATPSKIHIQVFETVSSIRRANLDNTFAHANPPCFVTLGADGLLDPHVRTETLLHELAHLFCFRLNLFPARFNLEGLSVWAQETEKGSPIDAVALSYLLTDDSVALEKLLTPDGWEHDTELSYILAGSFTGYLIHHFGLDAYWEFFRRADPRSFHRSFEECFGHDFSSVECAWRGELLRRRDELEPELETLVAERRIETACLQLRFDECIREYEGLSSKHRVTLESLVFIALAYQQQGHGERAAGVLQEALTCPNAGGKGGAGWYHAWLGRANDSGGRRDEAVRAYQAALSVPDCWFPEMGSSHKAARSGLKRPYR